MPSAKASSGTLEAHSERFDELQWQDLLNKDRIFVTGTDTEIGKTYVSGLLANQFAKDGKRVAYYKPCETGCRAEHGRLQSSEVATMLRSSAKALGTRVACTYRYELPLAPYTAAMQSGAIIDINRCVGVCEELAQSADVVIVEGAGGLLVPITQDETMLDLCLALDASPLLVAGNRLGCVNQTLLTDRVLRQAGLISVPVVLNNLREKDAVAQQSNRWTIEACLGRGLLAETTPLR